MGFIGFFGTVVANMIVLSHIQVRPLFKARDDGNHEAMVSLDLGCTQTAVSLSPTHLHLPNQTLTWEALEPILKAENNCFMVQDGEIEKIIGFSELTQRVHTLCPTDHAPTMLVSGLTMHRIKGTNPTRDTKEKLKSITPITGHVLDTCTGLGYTAIGAAQGGATAVVTCELDPATIEICRQNPWSQALFNTPNLTQRMGDSADLIETFADEQFDRVIHDPPFISFAGHLYAQDFYEQVHRVLKRKGKLFHYIGNPDSRSGSQTTRGVIDRLQKAGFKRVIRQPRAFGVLAIK